MTDRLKRFLDVAAVAAFALSALTAGWLLVKGCDAKNKRQIIDRVVERSADIASGLIAAGNDYSWPSTNCIFVGYRAGIYASNRINAVVLGRDLEPTANNQLSVRYADGTIERWPLKTNIDLWGTNRP